MANIVISSACNRSCGYCFASSGTSSEPFISLEDFQRALEFIDNSEIEVVRILGGEPTIHRHFDKILLLAQETDKEIMIFTNGITYDITLDLLDQIPEEKLHLLVNITPWFGDTDSAKAKQHRILNHFGERASLSFNIYQPDIPFDSILEIISDTGAKKHVRLGLAHPGPENSGYWLRPHHYSFVGSRVAEFAIVAADAGVTLSFDCGFVPCMFSDDELEKLREAEAETAWNCGPVLDIHLGRKLLYCYPLAGIFNIEFDSNARATDMRDEMDKQAEPYRQIGIFKDCNICGMKASGECKGGCLAVAMKRFF